MSVALVDCEAAQIPALRAFFRRAYSPSYRLANDDSLLRWQFSGPRGNGCHFKLAASGDQIYACLGYIPVALSIGGRHVRAAWTANWMVDQAYRRRGLGPLLLRQLMEEFDAVLSAGLDHDARELLPRMGWTDFGDLPRYVAVLAPRAAAQLTERENLNWPVSSEPGGDIAPVSVSETVPDATDLWDRLWGTRGAGTQRSTEFLAWRYGKHPTFSYRFLTWSAGPVRGIAVYRIETVCGLPITMGRIVELLADTSDVAPLAAAVLSDARKLGVAAVDFFCSSRSMSEPLAQAGFLPGHAEPARQIPVLFQPIDRNRSGIRFMAHLRNVADVTPDTDWYVTKGDGDQDRPN